MKLEQPSFKKTPAAKLDERLEEFFVRQLGYSAPVRNDPDERPCDPHYWRMVFPLPDSRPFAVAHQPNLSKMKRQEVARLYVNSVVPHRDGTPAQPAPILYVFTDGARFVFFSADTARNRDDRFDLSEETWRFEGLRAKVEALRVGSLVFRKRPGGLTPRVEFLFDSSHHSAEGQFRSHARDVRRQLMQEVAADGRALAAVIYHLLEAPEAREGRAVTRHADKCVSRAGDRYTLKRPLGELHRELQTRLGDALAAAVDTLLLRHVMARLLEAYHPEATAGPLDGDCHLTDLGRAARAVEEALLKRKATRASVLLRDFLGLTLEEAGASRRQFRYEDLRPKSLQDYYEDSLSTAVRLAYDAEADELRVEVGTSNRQRKELGAYYTNERLCRFMVERTVKPLFDERLERLRLCAERGTAQEARSAFEALMSFSVCDPTMGSAPFLRSAFDYLSESTQYSRLHRHVAALKGRHAALYEEIVGEYEFLCAEGGRSDADGIGGWEWHVLRRALYGVDIDPRAVCVACQTFALSPLRHLKEGERFPSFFNLNLKPGNALVSPTRPADRARLAAEHGAEIAELIRLRRLAQSLPNTEEAYAELLELFREADRVRLPIVSKLVGERVRPLLGEFTDELRPFSWELEFPEIFFNADGTLKAAAGFDVVIGNPPWEAIKFNDKEFWRSTGTRVGALREERGAVADAYEHYRAVIERWKSWVGGGGQYERQQGGRDRNKWRLATEVSWKLTRPRGALSLVVPGGIVANESGFALKQWLFAEGEAGMFVSFEKENEVFSGSQTFTVMSFRKGEGTRRVQHLEGLCDAEQLSALPFEPAFLPLELIREMSPSVLAIPCVRDDIDRSLLEKLYRHSLMTNAAADWHARTAPCDYHMSNDRRHLHTSDEGIPLLEGRSVEQYAVAPPETIRFRTSARRQVEPGGQYRVACADVAGTRDARRMLCAVLPHGYATGNHLNTLLVTGDDAERLFLVGVLNSFVIEWRVRQLARSNNINKFVLEQLPVPRPPRADVERVAALVAALVTADARFADLRPLLNGARPATAEAARHDIMCRVDAEVARLFGLTEEELGRVLDAFDKVPAATKGLVRAHFKTSRAGEA